jgi:protein-L-isoaspartate(D-aspartate) O-methyltransferase
MGNEELIKHMKNTGMLTEKRVEEAVRNVPRHLFIPKEYEKYAYSDEPLPIGEGQTISQPSVVVRMTEWLDPKKGDKILEIGAGSGWQAGILGYLVGPKGKVYTIERVRELVKSARKNLKKAGIKNVEVLEGDGTKGLPEKAPFDKVMITAATPKIPDPLVEQLKEGGRIIAPVGRFSQVMILAEKKKGKLEVIKREGWYRFVPLLGEHGFRE